MPAVTWLDIVKTQLAANPGKSVKDVVPEARKEWDLVKSGKHPTKTKGKMTFKKRKGKSRKSKRRPHKGEKSRTRPGHLAFRTHKGDKYFHRDGHVIKKSYAPYSRKRKHHKKSKGKTCKQKLKECKSKKHSRKSKSKSKSKSKRPASAWIVHVKAVAKKENISYKEALKVAGKSYNK